MTSSGAVAATKPSRSRPSPARFFWWVVFILGVLYFFLPLLATLLFALRSQPFLSAFTDTLTASDFWSALGYSFVIGIITIIISVVLILPTAFWVRLRVPRARPFVEFITLLPFVIPPVVIVFGLLQMYANKPLSLTTAPYGSDLLLIGAYVVLSLPYMYRSIDAGLRTLDILTLTEAAQSMGAGWGRILVQIILPNLRVSLLSGAFLTLAIVVGEYTIASFLARPAFGPFIALIGRNEAYRPAAVAIISFGLTWLAMGVIAVIGRGSRTRIRVVGAH
ncbi:MAG TPA: ABC transporter permease subunit [Candidatus Limnocylindrales bacterium]